MTKTNGILTIRPLSCYHHNKIQLALTKVKTILHLTLSLVVKKCNMERSLSQQIVSRMKSEQQ